MIRPSASRVSAPGCPLTSTGRSSNPPPRARDPRPAGERLDHLAAPVQRPRDRRDAAAAVAMQHDVLGQQRLELLDLAVASGGEEAARQLVAELVRGLVARPPLLDVAPRPGRQLARRRPRSCRRSPRSGRRGSRTPRAAGKRRAARARGSRARRGRRRTASRRARPPRPDRPPRRRRAARAATRRCRSRAVPGPSAAGRWRAGSPRSRRTPAATRPADPLRGCGGGGGGPPARRPPPRSRCRASGTRSRTRAASAPRRGPCSPSAQPSPRAKPSRQLG